MNSNGGWSLSTTASGASRLASIRTIRVGPRRNARSPSLVDQILCAAIEEPTARVGRLVTSDPTDFRVSCAHVGVQIVTLQQWAEELGIRR